MRDRCLMEWTPPLPAPIRSRSGRGDSPFSRKEILPPRETKGEIQESGYILSAGPARGHLARPYTQPPDSCFIIHDSIFCVSSFLHSWFYRVVMYFTPYIQVPNDEGKRRGASRKRLAASIAGDVLQGRSRRAQPGGCPCPGPVVNFIPFNGLYESFISVPSPGRCAGEVP